MDALDKQLDRLDKKYYALIGGATGFAVGVAFSALVTYLIFA
ncbi:hypothetical protein [Leeuwenhoekiella nanhaiensis]|nr:hypothetical protein [Leeuwenhoekiella nanhaiensis]